MGSSASGEGSPEQKEEEEEDRQGKWSERWNAKEEGAAELGAG